MYVVGIPQCIIITNTTDMSFSFHYIKILNQTKYYLNNMTCFYYLPNNFRIAVI